MANANVNTPSPEDDGSIHLDTRAAKWFHQSIYSLYDALYSLRTMSESFPEKISEPGEISPQFAVATFGTAVEPVLDLLLNLAIHEELSTDSSKLPRRVQRIIDEYKKGAQ